MAILFKPSDGASHWYDVDGTPVHSQPTKSGGERPTWISDAIRLGLLPSVTNVLGVIAKPELDTWKQKQVAAACLSNPKQEDESEEYWVKRVLEEAKKPVIEAADLGSKIHEALDQALDGQTVSEDIAPYIEPVLTWFTGLGIEVVAREIVLVNPVEGYAGRVDLLFKYGKNGIGVCDWKSRKTEPGKDITPYSGQGEQLAAYAAAYWGEARLHDVLLANIYISTTEPGRYHVHKYVTEEGTSDASELYECFRAACRIWRRAKGYDPRRAPSPA